MMMGESDDVSMKDSNDSNPKAQDTEERIQAVLREEIEAATTVGSTLIIGDVDRVSRNLVKVLLEDTKENWESLFCRVLFFRVVEGIVSEAKVEEIAKRIYESCIRKGLIVRRGAEQQDHFPRCSEITHGLDGTYFGTLDLDNFVERVARTFAWHDGHRDYVSPSFALVQSSGMGKTKLLKQYKNLSEMHQTNNVDVFLLLCVEEGVSLPADFNDHFDGCLRVPRIKDGSKIVDGLGRARGKVLHQLNGYVCDSTHKDIVLLIDEAQLLHTRIPEGGLYVAVRWWLRECRDKRIVAVFAGTSLSLTNYQHVRPPLGFSRDATVEYRNYKERDGDKGEHRKLYDPFFTITTMALDHVIKKKDAELFKERNSLREAETEDALFDIRRCGYFGRPLFASLLRYDEKRRVRALVLDPKSAITAENGNVVVQNNILHKILSRILLSSTPSWHGDKESLASVLATRVQMGVSTNGFAERATSHGYATLVDFRDSGQPFTNKNHYCSVSVAFPPDPICSALAMGLMQQKWSVGTTDGSGSTITGKPSTFWVKAAASIFDHGLFLPDRGGDAGDVFAALYMLLCGDELRAKEDAHMRKFEISFAAWCESLRGESDATDSSKKPKLTDDDGSAQKRRSPRIAKLKIDHELMDRSESLPLEDGAKYSLNFIQVCRNCFRTQAWFRQDALELMYDTCSGCYVFPNCPALDIVFPLKVSAHGREAKYHPVLVRVKCWDSIGGADMQNALDGMEEYLKDYRDGEEETTTALCMLIVIGSQSVGTLPSVKGSFPSTDGFLPVLVPANDKFGVHEVLVKRATSSARAEVLASHHCAHVEDPKYDPLRSQTKGDDRIFGEALLMDKNSLCTPKGSKGSEAQGAMVLQEPDTPGAS